MTYQSRIFLSETMTGVRIIDIQQKKTKLSHNTLNRAVADAISAAVRNLDDDMMTAIFAQLLLAAEQGGWGKAPAGYCLKHNGYMAGVGTFTPSGVKADYDLVVRTDSSVI